MNPADARDAIQALPKAELHLHLEGSIEPLTVVELAARHGVQLNQDEAIAHYSYGDFRGFLDAFKWVTSLLREPEDYALITRRLAERLLAQNVVYAEVTVAVGVMLWREQNVERNFAALAEALGKRRLRFPPAIVAKAVIRMGRNRRSAAWIMAVRAEDPEARKR